MSNARFNNVWFPVLGDRQRHTANGLVSEPYDRLMWPAVDWTTDNLIDIKIRSAVEAEREESKIGPMASAPDASVEIKYKNWYSANDCPNCNISFAPMWQRKFKFCHGCGKKIEWT